MLNHIEAKKRFKQRRILESDTGKRFIFVDEVDQNKIETTKQPMENLPAVNGGPISLEKKGNVIENNIFNSIF